MMTLILDPEAQKLKEMDLHEAIDRLEKLRADHNGIFGIEIFLGHDGNNVVRLNNYESTIGKGETGTSLLTAVRRAESSWRLHNLLNSTWGQDTVEKALQVAIEKFGDEGDGIFNTASFQVAINLDGYAQLLASDVETLLLSFKRIVRLFGGSHWLRLPGNYERE